MKKLLLLIPLLCIPLILVAQQSRRYTVSGIVLITGTDRPIGQAVVELPRLGLWAVADDNGHFEVKNVSAGDVEFVVSCLGYVTTPTVVPVRGDTDALRLYAPEDNLKLEDVVVTAKATPNAMSTSREIGSNAIDHLQMVNASDISALLPGGKTVNPNLTEDSNKNRFMLRSGGEKAGNAAFGTAVEVDGVRLSTNASLGDINGASTRNVASTNVDAVEVITGVPSAEYGDVSSGIVKISTRKGKSPYLVTLSTNPRTKQISASKGFDLSKNRGVINSSVEYTRATKNPVSPYESYTRTGISLNYGNTFAKSLRFDLGVTGNIGGMDTKNDPDAFIGTFTKSRDNAFRANTALKWQVNKPWLTSVNFTASVNYEDNFYKDHSFQSAGAKLPAVHAEENGYFITQMLPSESYFTTQYIDSRELDVAASLKADWVRNWGGIYSHAKIGAAFTSTGNVGQGEYYENPALAKDGYRPRPYTDIPFMNNLAGWIEETISFPIGSTNLQLMAGLRAEKTFIKGTAYNNTSNLSPRLNLKYSVGPKFSVRAGWGITEKLPSFNILYPPPKYNDTRIFSTSYGANSMYVYHTQLCALQYNPDLRWQRNRNAEVGVDFSLWGTHVSLVGFFNRTKYPYKLSTGYDPISYMMGSVPSKTPDGEAYKLPTNPLFRVDSQTGEIFVRDADNPALGWVPMDSRRRQTFAKNTRPDNSSPVDRMGLEFVVDFPEIRPIRTQLRLDGAYTNTYYVNEGEAYILPSVTQRGEPYPYVGIYPDNGGDKNATDNGLNTHAFDANLTAITHIPAIRMIITLRLEASLYHRSQNISKYNGGEYAFNIAGNGDLTPSGGSVYEGNSYTAMYPVAYLDLQGNRHPFTAAEAANPDFADLILTSNNIYKFNQDGYDPYFSANLSVTKEIGNHVSISFYANNFTNARKSLKYYATGVPVILTPDFYYGLTLRLKF